MSAFWPSLDGLKKKMKESAGRASNRVGDEEEELIRGCQLGDSRCLEILIRSHLRMVLSVACRFADDFAEAEDLCQEVFCKVTQKISGFRGESRVRTWIYSTAVAHCIDHRRRKRPPEESLPLETDTARRSAPGVEDPEHSVLVLERAAAVHTAVNSLPDELKTVVLLYDFEDLSHREIAQQIGVPEGTVWSRLHRARVVLREKLSRLL
jgi:RNA polymerase sigma-70 factor (ECF subfamily)